MRSCDVAVVTVVGVLAASGCGGNAPTSPASPSGPPPGQGRVLLDADAGRLAGMALDAWALGRSATAYQVDRCSRADAATARCVASVRFADNPSNPQDCSLAITVVATSGRVGVKHAAPGTDLEVEDYPLSNGGYGTYVYGDESMCDQAQYTSGF